MERLRGELPTVWEKGWEQEIEAELDKQELRKLANKFIRRGDSKRKAERIAKKVLEIKDLEVNINFLASFGCLRDIPNL
jgi:hypothetical protein